MKERYTSKEIAERFSVSTGRLSQLRNGYVKVVNGKEYFQPPRLKQGKHYIWQKRNIFFTQDGFEFMEKHYGNGH